jgi:predicted nucleic acid-binding protein
LIVDAGPLIAWLDADDPGHAFAVELLTTHPGPLIVPALVIAEVTYMVAAGGGAEPEVRFLGDLASGALLVEPVHAADWMRIAELVWRYRDLRLGTVDASVVAAAERLGLVEVATFDRRRFGVIRPAHTDAFTIVAP